MVFKPVIEHFKHFEVLHHQTLVFFLQQAIEDVAEEHSLPTRDQIDDTVAEKSQRERIIACLECGAPNSKTCQNCIQCGTKGAITAVRQAQKEEQKNTAKTKQKRKAKVSFKEVTQDSHPESFQPSTLSYTYIDPHEKTTHKKLIITQPVLCNPTGKYILICVLHHIGVKCYICLYCYVPSHGDKLREWTVLVVDGLPYLIIKALKELVVIYLHPDC